MIRDDLHNRDIPDVPGVYLFKQGGKTLYIGKATSLKERLRSYFAGDLVETRGGHIVGMVDMADDIAWQETDSVLEALILESELIRKNKPRFNTLGKDDKSYNYVVITKEDFPRVLLVRGRDLEQVWDKKDIKKVFGPFTQGKSLKIALGIIRKIFPFRDTCTPGAGKPCFNRQIGLCPGVCSGEVSQTEYADIIRNIILMFSAKKRELLRKLEKDMKAAAKKEQFEHAAALQRQVAALQHIRDIALVSATVRNMRDEARSGFRIEGYDIAHTSGTATLGVMTVVIDGEPEKAEYRTFNVRGVTNNDTAALKEVLQRRLTHPEWQYPKLIVIDGGKGQLRTAEKVLKAAGIEIPVVSVVKDEHHRPRDVLGDADIVKKHNKAIILVNAEAHRTAVARHRARRQRAGGVPKRSRKKT